MSALVEPDDDVSPRAALEDDLLLHGVPPDPAAQIAAWALADHDLTWWPSGVVLNPLRDESRMKSLVATCAAAWRDAASDRGAVTDLLRRLVLGGAILDRSGEVVRAGPDPAGPLATQAAVLPVVLPLLRDLGLDVAHATALPDQDPRLLRVLCTDPGLHEALSPAEFLDRPSLRKWNPIASRSGHDASGPAHIGYWLELRGAAVIPQLARVVADEAPETMGRVAGAVLQELAHPIGRHPGADLLADPAAFSALEDLCRNLLDRANEAAGEDAFCLAAAFEAASMIEQSRDLPMDSEIVKRSGEVAGRALGLLRKKARDRLQDPPLPEAHRARTAHGAALVALARAKGLGPMLWSGVQLLRALPEPCVPSDLRWWHEDGLEAPHLAWGWLPMAMAALVHSRGRIEQESDQDLVAARATLAGHLLDRLKPRKEGSGAADLTEPSAIWRQCCIRAVQELGVNPGGRGHRVLYKAEEADPDPDVRRLANTARHEVRHATAAPDSHSPRRRLMAAIWWLRQAHRIALGLDVDPSGARRTRQREISMATDPARSLG